MGGGVMPIKGHSVLCLCWECTDAVLGLVKPAPAASPAPSAGGHGSAGVSFGYICGQCGKPASLNGTHACAQQPPVSSEEQARPLRLVLWPRLDPGEQLRVDGTTEGALIQVGLGAHPVTLDPSECESVAAVLLSVARVARHMSAPAPAADLDAAEHGYRPEGEGALP
jgi:hypothetical protein